MQDPENLGENSLRSFMWTHNLIPRPKGESMQRHTPVDVDLYWVVSHPIRFFVSV